MFNKLKNYKSLLTMAAISAMANFAKAENYENVEALPNGQVLVHNTDAQIDGVKTPFMFVENDLTRGFAPEAIENATSVASDGTNCYANVDGKVKAFKLSESGIPSAADTNAYDMVYTDGIDTVKVDDAKIIAADKDGFVATFDNMVAKFNKTEVQPGQTNYVATKATAVDGLCSTYVDGTNIYIAADGRVSKIDLENGKKAKTWTTDGVTSFIVVNNVPVYGTEDGSFSKMFEKPFDAPVMVTLSKDKKYIYATSENASESNKCVRIDTANGQTSNIVMNVSSGLKKVIDNGNDNRILIYATKEKLGLHK